MTKERFKFIRVVSESNGSWPSATITTSTVFQHAYPALQVERAAIQGELDHHASDAYQQESANAEGAIVDAGSGTVLATYVGTTIEIERADSWSEDKT